jgi:hypothetical protein
MQRYLLSRGLIDRAAAAPYALILTLVVGIQPRRVRAVNDYFCFGRQKSLPCPRTWACWIPVTRTGMRDVAGASIVRNQRLREISTPIFRPPSSFPKLTPSRYRIHRQACRRGGIGAGCEGETQNLISRVRENGLPPWLANRHVLRVSPLECPGRACEAHNAVAKVGRRSQRDRSSGINRRTGRWKAPYYFYSIAVFSSAPSECSAWWRHGPEGCVGIWCVGSFG